MDRGEDLPLENQAHRERGGLRRFVLRRRPCPRECSGIQCLPRCLREPPGQTRQSRKMQLIQPRLIAGSSISKIRVDPRCCSNYERHAYRPHASSFTKSSEVQKMKATMNIVSHSLRNKSTAAQTMEA